MTFTYSEPIVYLEYAIDTAMAARKAGVAKRYREMCWKLALERFGVAGRLLGLPDEPAKVAIHLDFFPPRRGARDDDNAEAAFKAGRDGVASALRVDDSRFVVSRNLRDEPLGCVVATFTGIDALEPRRVLP